MQAWDEVLANALELIKTKMDQPNLADYRHYDMTGKICPSPFVNTTIVEVDPRWVKFRDRIRKALTAG